MPNHCHNDLYIDGPDDDVRILLDRIGASETPPRFDFNAVIPYPERFRVLDDDRRAFEKEHGWQKARELMLAKHGTESDGFNSGGYEWCIENWGTKWGAYEVARRDYERACITFQTAWGPAPLVIAALHRAFPRVSMHLEYFELGMAIAGGMSFLSKDDSDLEKWAAGTPERKWETREYHGSRGG